MLHEFHHQHSFSVPENSCHQLSGRQRLFKLFLSCLVNGGLSTALSALWFQDSQTKPKFHHMLLLLYDLEINRNFRGTALKSQRRNHSLSFARFLENFRNLSCAKLATIA
jgi:hypothetical protein